MKKLKTKPSNPIKTLRYKQIKVGWVMNIDQTTMAATLGITQSLLSKIESETAKPETDVMNKILSIYGQEKFMEIFKYYNKGVK